MANRVTKLLVVVGIALFLAAAEGLILFSPLHAADGDLDATFGPGGKVTTDFEGRLRRTSLLTTEALSHPARVTVDVPTPSSDAIQKAIDELPPEGGEIFLSADTPYIFTNAVRILKDNVSITGRGSGLTRLKAKPGASLVVSDHAEEHMILVQNARGVQVTALKVDTINEVHGVGRVGIGVWNSTSILIARVKFVNNLGPHDQNRGLSFNQSSNVSAKRCGVSGARHGIFVWQSTDFSLSNCKIHDCQEDPSFPGPIGGISVIESTSGLIQSCVIQKNTVHGGIFLIDCSDLTISTCKIRETLHFQGTEGNDGIFVDLSKRGTNTIRDCVVEKNSGSGIGISRSSNVLVDGCRIADNGTSGLGSGITLIGDVVAVQVSGNQISHSQNPDYGGVTLDFDSLPVEANQIDNNIVSGFGIGVGLGPNSGSNRITDNDLRLNRSCVLDLGTGNIVTGNQCP